MNSCHLCTLAETQGVETVMRDLIRRKQRHVRYYIRNVGLIGLLKKLISLFRDFVFLEYQWWIVAIDLNCYDSEARIDLEHRRLFFEDLHRLKFDKIENFPELIRDRFKSGAICHAFFRDGDLANVCWTSDGYLEIIPGLVLKIGNCRGLFDITTLEKYRNQGINSVVNSYLASLGKADGFDGMVAAIHPGNTASIKSLERAGYRKLYLLNRKVFFGVERLSRSAETEQFLSNRAIYEFRKA